MSVDRGQPSNIFASPDLQFLSGFKVEPVVAAETSIKNAINKHYDSAGLVKDILQGFDDREVATVEEGDEGPDVGDLQRATEDAPVGKLGNLILSDAIKKGASASHIEPYEKSF